MNYERMFPTTPLKKVVGISLMLYRWFSTNHLLTLRFTLQSGKGLKFHAMPIGTIKTSI